MKTTIAALLAGVTLIPCLQAQEGPEMHTRLGVGWTSQYFFRAILQQNGGIILQPFIEAGRSDIDIGMPLSRDFGLWSSLHEG